MRQNDDGKTVASMDLLVPLVSYMMKKALLILLNRLVRLLVDHKEKND